MTLGFVFAWDEHADNVQSDVDIVFAALDAAGFDVLPKPIGGDAVAGAGVRGAAVRDDGALADYLRWLDNLYDGEEVTG